MRETVQIVEVGPRDGLQNESRPISVADKVRLIDLLSPVGFRRIEAASFVSPRWVPQMAGSAEVMRVISRKPGVKYSALVPNLRGFEAALAAGVDEVAIFTSASEGFSRANINASLEDALKRYRPVVEAAKASCLQVRGYVSCVVDCPYEGRITPSAVARAAEDLARLGCFEVSLGETLGRGTPDRVEAMLSSVTNAVPPEKLAGHFHDTTGRALENIEVALEFGLRTIDASVAGLGGCPFAPGAAGNVATEAVAEFLDKAGYEHNLDLATLKRAREAALKIRGD